MAKQFDIPNFRRQHATPFARALSNRKMTEAWRHRQRLSELLDILTMQCPEYEEFIAYYVALRLELEEARKQLRGLVEIVSPTRPNAQRVKQERLLEKSMVRKKLKVIEQEGEVVGAEATEEQVVEEKPFVYRSAKVQKTALEMLNEVYGPDGQPRVDGSGKALAEEAKGS